jgi:hypothetical protein
LLVVLLAFCGLSGGTEDGSGGVPGQTAGRLSRVHGRYGIEASFDADYVNVHADRVTVRVPEVFELANIAFAITDYGMESPYRVFKDSGYYEEVLERFGAFRDHPLIAEVEFSDRRLGDYFEWRTSSLAYEFEGRRIVAGDHYAPTGEAAGWFHDQLDLLEDFAAATDFREFYAAHRGFYERQIASYREKVPVRRMWRWLETEFPRRYDGYVVVFSPLINASHNTLRFEDGDYRECIMVVGGPDLLAQKTNDARVEEALLSRHVFTEIDHNYVNPVSAEYAEDIAAALDDLGTWNEQDGYATGFSTFNEYVTWAAFLLYAQDHYDDEVLELVRDYVIRTMEGGRSFVRFGEFVAWLETRWASRGTEERLVDLYPEMIAWFVEN